MKNNDPIFKLLDLIEKEVNLYDRRPKKERKYHPNGECYMNDILALVDKYYERKKSKTTKKSISRGNTRKRYPAKSKH